MIGVILYNRCRKKLKLTNEVNKIVKVNKIFSFYCGICKNTIWQYVIYIFGGQNDDKGVDKIFNMLYNKCVQIVIMFLY